MKHLFSVFSQLKLIFLLGHSIFIVFGELPPCEADEILRITPVTESPENEGRPSEIPCIDIDNDDDDESLQLALQMSLQDSESVKFFDQTNITTTAPEQGNFITALLPEN